MPLQIRRGTNLQRQAMTQALANGELLWVTDDKKLYIGDGATLPNALPPVTGFTSEEAVDAVGAALVAGNATNTNITFTYDSVPQDFNNRINAAVNLSNYVGVITADAFKGSLFADDGSTVGGTQALVDSLTGTFYLDGTVATHIVPNNNEQFDLGSSANRFRDLYLSGSSIKLGAATITAIGTGVNLPAGSTINGEPLGAFSVGQNINVNIVGDDSTVLVNTSTNTHQGQFNGLFKGSFFGEDSTQMLDGHSNVVRASQLEIGGLTLTGTDISRSGATNVINFRDTGIDVYTEAGTFGQGYTAYGTTLGVLASSIFQAATSRGTTTAPTIIQNGDTIGGIIFSPFNGTDYQLSASVTCLVDGAPTPGADAIASKIVFAVANSSSSFVSNNNQMTFDSKGVLAAPVFKLTSYADDAARSTAIATPAAGMMVFMASGTSPTVTNKVVVYDGSAWVALH